MIGYDLQLPEIYEVKFTETKNTAQIKASDLYMSRYEQRVLTIN